jgi:hypothetical protein
MFRNFLFLSAFDLFVSCNTNKQKPANTVPQSTTENTEGKENLPIPMLISKNFIEIDSLSDYVMYPLTWRKDIDQKKWLGAGYSSSDNTTNYHDWNVLFYNVKTKKSHLLHQQTNLFITDIIIKDEKQEEYNNSSYSYRQIYHAQKSGISKPNYIFYLVVSEDYNKNGILEKDIDPTYLYISDREGKNFRQLSPKNIHVEDWKFVSQNEILLYGIQDINQDKVLDDNEFDRNTPFHITILPNEIKTDIIIPDSLQQVLQKQFSEFYAKSLLIKEEK